MVSSYPANAATSITSVERGRWKFVTRRSTARNACGGGMKIGGSPEAAANLPAPPPARLEGGEQLGREVEPRRRRGHGAGLARVDRLVALRVVRRVAAVDVG